ncbi:MAG: hypothetical protein DRR08_25270 [Candidatus Parabeggiatoa sp. nov. 2]|nr:MAG: hypothetical protein B6247_27870 [Beggiatoa sp. 4572_84]RKZ55100.1 MAG: hypothetical protein DRR08_25270 [Gammaproteobacteria bacterium]HEC84582.1 OmpA family protein [Thioploca sp.]
MFDCSGRKILIGAVTGTLLSTAAMTVTAATDKITHRLLDSQGNPVLTTRPHECVQTPKTPNVPPAGPFEICGDVLDRDGDGVNDDEDECDNTNNPEAISEGVYDNAVPPGRPNNRPPQSSSDRLGCPIDRDGDGVEDYRDDCPDNTRLEISKGVDSRGCALDTDQDGVEDYKDKCSRTPFGIKVDQHGCAIIKKELQVVVLAGDVTFAYNKADLTPQAETTLEELVNQIDVKFVKSIEIVGHTDSVGSEGYNQELSERRANSVTSYLQIKGIPSGKIQTRGEGESNPIDSNSTKIGRAKNRRVEITITRFEKK